MSEHRTKHGSTLAQGSEPSVARQAQRREFLQIAGTAGLGLGAAASVGVPVVRVMVGSFDRTGSGDLGTLVEVGKKSQFPADGTPTRVDLVAERNDAWNRIPNVRIGSAWIINHDGHISAFTTVCPHLACSVDYQAESGQYFCPCHDSWFDAQGGVLSGPAPRGLDPLQVEDKDGVIAIHYQRFVPGVAERRSIG